LLFKRKKSRREDDRVWATRAGKFEGVCDEVMHMTQTGTPVLLIAHFADTMEDAKKAMDERDIPYNLIPDRWAMARLDLHNLKAGDVIAFLSDLVVSRSSSNKRSGRQMTKDTKIHITVVEHYPIPDGDAAVLSFVEKLPPEVTVRFHASLDEPLLVAFGADRTFALLERLGWDKTGCVSNPAITRAIASGQARIKRVAASDEKVNSQREWFYYNCPILKR
jgi:hypothetical protein